MSSPPVSKLNHQLVGFVDVEQQVVLWVHSVGLLMVVRTSSSLHVWVLLMGLQYEQERAAVFSTRLEEGRPPIRSVWVLFVRKSSITEPQSTAMIQLLTPEENKSLNENMNQTSRLRCEVISLHFHSNSSNSGKFDNYCHSFGHNHHSRKLVLVQNRSRFMQSVTLPVFVDGGSLVGSRTSCWEPLQ